MLIDRFEQTGAKRPVNLQSGVDDLTRQCIQFGRDPLVLLASLVILV
jgi:hypothetical protein